MLLIINFSFYLILCQAEHLQNETISWPCDIQVPPGPEDLKDFASAVLGMYSTLLEMGNVMLYCKYLFVYISLELYLELVEKYGNLAQLFEIYCNIFYHILNPI